MKRVWLFLTFGALIAILALAGCGGNAGESTEGADQGETADLDRVEPPAEYASLTNPVNCDDAAVSAGQTVFNTNCSSCHGETGKGDGPAAASLNPAPSNLADNEEGLSDAFLFWRISEGGAMDPFNSTMPAWKSVLSEDQIWQSVCYIHDLE